MKTYIHNLTKIINNLESLKKKLIELDSNKQKKNRTTRKSKSRSNNEQPIITSQSAPQLKLDKEPILFSNTSPRREVTGIEKKNRFTIKTLAVDANKL